MKPIVLRNEADRKLAMAKLVEVPADGTHMCEIKESSTRSVAQNRLGFLWYKSIGSQTYDDPESIRRFCKLTFGIPILSESDSDFAQWWDSVAADWTYEMQIESMAFVAVTRRFSVTQKTEYLRNMDHYYGRQGIILPQPEDIYFSAMGYSERQPSRS